MAQASWGKGERERDVKMLNIKLSFTEEKINFVFMVSHMGLCLNIPRVPYDFSSALKNP